MRTHLRRSLGSVSGSVPSYEEQEEVRAWRAEQEQTSVPCETERNRQSRYLSAVKVRRAI